MFLRRLITIAAILLSFSGATTAHADYSAPPAIELYPDEYPVGVAFFFPAGYPLERFTSQPGVWYAIYRIPMRPGRPYDILLSHAGDPSRMKVYALDNHPFDKVLVKYEINLRRLEFGGKQNAVYGTTISTPPYSAANSVYLLLEWTSPISDERPIPLVLQVLSSMPIYMSEDRRDLRWSCNDAWKRPLHDLYKERPLQDEKSHTHDLHIESPLQSERRRYTNEIPLPRY